MFLLLALIPFAAPAQTPAQPAAPAQATPAYTEDQILEAFGWFVGKQSQLGVMEFNQDQMTKIMGGFALALQQKQPSTQPEAIAPTVQAFFQSRQSMISAKLKDQNTAAAADFFKELKGNPKAQGTPSGLFYEVVAPGSGTPPQPTDTVRVNYTGKLINGTVFDSSASRGPAEFKLNQVIAGWTEGLQKVSAGGRIRLYIPANLAYGDSGRPGIPPASTLIFDIDLLEIRK